MGGWVGLGVCGWDLECVMVCKGPEVCLGGEGRDLGCVDGTCRRDGTWVGLGVCGWDSGCRRIGGWNLECVACGSLP